MMPFFCRSGVGWLFCSCRFRQSTEADIIANTLSTFLSLELVGAGGMSCSAYAGDYTEV